MNTRPSEKVHLNSVGKQIVFYVLDWFCPNKYYIFINSVKLRLFSPITTLFKTTKNNL